MATTPSPELFDTLETSAQERQLRFEMEQRSWMDVSLNQMDDVLRLNYDKSLPEFCDVVIFHLSKLVGSLQGAFFVLDPADDLLKMEGGYACRPDQCNKHFRVGEGLIGQAVKSRESFFLEDVPSRNAVVESGLAQVSSSYMAILPLLFNDKAYGVIELSSLHTMPEQARQLLDRVSKNIASTLQSIQNNLRTKHLLQESQQLAEHLRAQEEELRQNLEELAITHEQMHAQQQELEDFRLRFRQFIDSSQDRMLLLDKDLKIQLANRNFIERAANMGLSLQEGKTSFFDIYTGDNWNDMQENLQLALTGETAVFVHKHHEHGHTYYFRKTLCPVQDVEGNIIGISLVAQDYTEVQELFDRIQQKDTQMGAFVDSSSEFMGLLDMEFRIVQGNKPFMSFFNAKGVSVVLGETRWPDLFEADDYAKNIQTTTEQAMSGTEASYQHGYRFPDGSMRYYKVRLTPVFSPEGAVIYVAAIAQDYTKEYLQEQEIARFRQVFRMISATTQDQLALIGCNLQLICWSETFAKLLADGQVLQAEQTEFSSLFPEKEWKPLRALLDRAWQGEQIDTTINLSFADGRTLPYTLHVQPVSTAEGSSISHLLFRGRPQVG